MAASEYRKVAKARMAFGQASLWLGSDHLLSVTRRGYTEEYKRFYYKDIQAVYFRRTILADVVNLVFGLISAMWIALIVYGWLVGHWAGSILAMLMTFGSIFLIVFLNNLVRGATCVCYLRTAVQTERLFALQRMRLALKAVRQIRPRVEAIQGAFAAEPLSPPSEAQS